MMKYVFENSRIRIQTNGRYKDRTISDFFDDFRQSSRNRYLLLRDEMILLDGEPVSSQDTVVGDREITLLIPEEEPGWPAADTPCETVYEDPFLFIVHKEAGIIIHDDIHPENCLNAMAAKYLQDKGIRCPVRPLHRLDKDTRGLVLYSKIPFFQPLLDEQMRQKKIIRRYLAVSYGDCRPGSSFLCSGAIGRDRHRSGAYRISETGRPARTNVKCLARRGPYCLFECTLDTGRTHQIRVHLSAEGFPIVNDPLYGRPSRDFPAMGLCACEIVFRTPVTNKKHRITDRMPAEMLYFSDIDQEEN